MSDIFLSAEKDAAAAESGNLMAVKPELGNQHNTP